MSETENLNAYCPNCHGTGGKPWDLCQSPSCAHKGYHLIPREYAKVLQANPKKNHELVGQVIQDRYLLVQKIGSGGMGFILLGLQKPFMREVAVKVISAAKLDESNKERFAREARALSTLDHPNIVKLLDYGVHEIEAYQRELPFMVLEYVKNAIELGQFFKQLRRKGKQASRKVVVHIFSQVLSALETAHSQGLIHRDIKPANILLKKVAGNPFMVKLLDFGLAKAIGEANASAQQLTSDGMLVGTPQYLAPEQGDIRKLYEGKIDHRADLYSVGVTLYEVLTGAKPFPFKDDLKILVMKSSPRFNPLKAPEAKDLPEEVKAFLKKAMARDPQDRFQSAKEFRHAMKKALLSSDVGIKGIAESDEDSSSTPELDFELIDIAADSEEDFMFTSSSSVEKVIPPPLPGGGGTKETGETAEYTGTAKTRSDVDIVKQADERTGISKYRRKKWIWLSILSGIAVMAVVVFMVWKPQKSTRVQTLHTETKPIAKQTLRQTAPEFILTHRRGPDKVVIKQSRKASKRRHRGKKVRKKTKSWSL